MGNRFRIGWLFALVALSCSSDPSDSDTSKQQQPASSAAQQAITLTTSGQGLVQQATAKGTVIKLDQQFQAGVLARRNDDGSLSVECHDEQAAADAFVQGASRPTHTLEVQ